VSASRFGPAPSRSAAIDDVRRGRGLRASIVLMSGHGTRGACVSDARNAKEDVDTDVDATDARNEWSRRHAEHVAPAARRHARRRRSGHGCAQPNGRGRLRRRGFAQVCAGRRWERAWTKERLGRVSRPPYGTSRASRKWPRSRAGRSRTARAKVIERGRWTSSGECRGVGGCSSAGRALRRGGQLSWPETAGARAIEKAPGR
jgi:hypothetical protein